MYTDSENENLYEEDNYETVSTWDNNKGLIFKIIIIILCIIVLIWLIKSLKNNRNLSDNGEVHIANVEKVRLAAEDYFFIKDNKDKNSYVSIAGLKNNGLLNDVIDANNKVCNEHSSKVNLDSDIDTYNMTVSLSCSTNDKNEVFYYHKNTLACLNCNGKTNMTGKEIVIAKEDEKENKDNNGGNNNVSDDIPVIDDEYKYYSCVNWSDWDKNRIYDSTLTERSKTLVLGVKYGTTTKYSDWSEFSTAPVEASDTIEVETKTVTESSWSENKTGTDVDTNNSNIKVIGTETVNNSKSYCKDGYIENNTCYSNKVLTGNLTMEEYNSGKYKILNNRCERVKTLLNKDGLYVLTYVNCKYNSKIETSNINSSYTLYTYQVLENKDVIYYRYRTLVTVNEPAEYTSQKYEEKDLPEGFVKVDGSEETYYSYKMAECTK